MINDKDFLTFINDKSLDGSLEEKYRKIIDEETEKPEEEMDTELIEYCLDKLNELEEKGGKVNGDSDGKVIKIRYKKVIAIAAVVIVLFIGTLSASATIFDTNLLVELYNDYIRINFDKINDCPVDHDLLETELAKELAENGFDTVLLPEALFSEDYKITNIYYEKSVLICAADVNFKYNFKSGNIFVRKYAMEEVVPDVEYLNVTEEIETLEVNGMTVFCFMQDKEASLAYRDGLTLYTIHLPMDLEEAIEFAKTIK